MMFQAFRNYTKFIVNTDCRSFPHLAALAAMWESMDYLISLFFHKCVFTMIVAFFSKVEREGIIATFWKRRNTILSYKIAPVHWDKRRAFQRHGEVRRRTLSFDIRDDLQS